MATEKNFSEIGDDRAYYAPAYHIVKTIGKAALGFKVRGSENIPPEGRALIAANHRHWLDIFLLPTSVPRRHLSMLAKQEIYDTPILGSLFGRWGGISVDRENPGSSTFREVVARLEDERLVAVLPEGHRYQLEGLGPLNNGIARWARLGAAPTIPSAIRGVDSAGSAIRHRNAEVVFGEAIAPPSTKNDEDRYLEELRSSIQALYES